MWQILVIQWAVFFVPLKVRGAISPVKSVSANAANPDPVPIGHISSGMRAEIGYMHLSVLALERSMTAMSTLGFGLRGQVLARLKIQQLCLI